MSNYIMSRESLKLHCKAICDRFKDFPTSGTYREHRLILDLLEQTEWIPVKDKLPEEDGRFLTYIENPYNRQLSYIMVCDYINKSWCPDDETASSNVVAWMPLLEEPYKED